MFNYPDPLQWQPDRGFWCFGPGGLSSDLGIFIWWLGIENLVVYSFVFFLVPFAIILATSTLIYWLKNRIVLIRSSDLYLAVSLTAVWLVLVIAVPNARSPLNFLEMSALGGLAALTVVARIPSAPKVWSNQSRVGAFGISCVAICFWAFIPAF